MFDLCETPEEVFLWTLVVTLFPVHMWDARRIRNLLLEFFTRLLIVVCFIPFLAVAWLTPVQWWTIKCRFLKSGAFKRVWRLLAALQSHAPSTARMLVASTNGAGGGGVDLAFNDRAAAEAVFGRRADAFAAAGLGERDAHLTPPHPDCEHVPIRVILEFTDGSEELKYRCMVCGKFIPSTGW
jgi:hypothetical protein